MVHTRSDSSRSLHGGTRLLSFRKIDRQRAREKRIGIAWTTLLSSVYRWFDSIFYTRTVKRTRGANTPSFCGFVEIDKTDSGDLTFSRAKRAAPSSCSLYACKYDEQTATTETSQYRKGKRVGSEARVGSRILYSR